MVVSTTANEEHELRDRLARVEEALARLTEQLVATNRDGQTFAAPLRVMDTDGNVIVEIGVDMMAALSA